MRIPASMRSLRPIVPAWLLVVIGGTVVFEVVLFFMIVFPWHEIGLVVDKSELPRALSKKTPHVYFPRRSFAVDADGRTWIIDKRIEAIALEDIEAVIRQWRATEEPDPHRRDWLVGIRPHRQAPWSAVHGIIGAAVRAGETTVNIEMQRYRGLNLILADVVAVGDTLLGRRQVREQEIILSAVPATDLGSIYRDVREQHRLAEAAGEAYRPVVRLAVAADSSAEAVLHALECYAVRLKVVRPGEVQWWASGVCVAGFGP